MFEQTYQFSSRLAVGINIISSEERSFSSLLRASSGPRLSMATRKGITLMETWFTSERIDGPNRQ
jgi:hypothetical protein